MNRVIEAHTIIRKLLGLEVVCQHFRYFIPVHY